MLNTILATACAITLAAVFVGVLNLLIGGHFHIGLG